MGLADVIHIPSVRNCTYFTEKEHPPLAYLARELWSQSTVHFVPMIRKTCDTAAAGGFRPHLTVFLLLSLFLQMLLDKIKHELLPSSLDVCV